MTEEKRRAVDIPQPLYERISEKIKGTGFTTVSDYVTHCVRQTLTREEEPASSLSKADEEKIKARLKALGYL